MSTPAHIDPAIAEQAVEWMIELQTPPVSAVTLAQWRAWLQAHPEHALAWQRVEAFGQQLAGVGGHSQIAHAALSLPTDSGLGRRAALKTLAVAVSLGALGWAGRDTAVWQNLSADHSSAIGEQRHLTLADGSRVLLNTDSAIDVRFDNRARRLRLLRGEVQIEVAADPLRAFFAHTDAGHVRTDRSRFLLRQERAYSRLAVTDGVVTLHAGALPAIDISAGQQLLFSAEQLGPLRPLSEADQAWTDGIIIADNQRLEDFLHELGRYRPGHLGCARSLADLRIAGTYPLADTERILHTLGTALDLRVRRFTSYWVTLEPRQAQV